MKSDGSRRHATRTNFVRSSKLFPFRMMTATRTKTNRLRVELRNIGIPLWQSPLLSAIPNVRHGFTTRLGGVSTGPYESLNLSLNVGDNPDNVLENRRRLAQTLNLEPRSICLQQQVHGADVIDTLERMGDASICGDAFVTDCVDVPVLVGVADCVPILVAARDGSAVAAIHAGWRGAVAGVIEATIRRIVARYTFATHDLVAAVGPSIGKCCFEVGDKVA
ncbi:MAG TPA: laccase domain-containing protein, partial [Firmicutes bacterium]|nr:laccase domain-containing protein [Bacillota bacterium]